MTSQELLDFLVNSLNVFKGNLLYILSLLLRIIIIIIICFSSVKFCVTFQLTVILDSHTFF